MRQLLTFILIGFYSTVFCQVSPSPIKPFQADDGSQTGFVNQTGDTIYQPQFDGVRQAMFYDRDTFKSYYEVMKNSKDGMNQYGMLSMYGEPIIPIEYERSIQPCFNGCFVMYIEDESENGYCVVSSLNERLSAVYDEIYADRYLPYVRVYKDDNYGILNEEFKEIIPPIYKFVERKHHYERDSYTSLKYEYYEVESENGFGIADLKGNILVLPHYQSVQPRLLNRRCEKTEVFFEVQNNANLWGVLGKDGREIVPQRYAEIACFIPEEFAHNFNGEFNCSSPTLAYCFVEEAGYSVVYNLVSGKKSRHYSGLSLVGDRILFQDEGSFGILNDVLIPIMQTDSFELSFNPEFEFISPAQPYFRSDKSRKYASDEEVLKFDLTVLQARDNVVFFRSRENPQKMGLMNYVTQKRIANCYDSILLRRVNTEDFYWAFKTDLLNPNQRMDLYNEDMKLVRTMELSAIQLLEPFDHTFQSNSSTRIFVVKSRDDKIGALNILGDTVIPFVYSKFNFDSHQYSWPGKKKAETPELCFFGKEDAWELWNTNGDCLISNSYVEIRKEYWPITFFRCEKNGLFDIYTENYELSFEACLAVFKKFKPERNGYSKSENDTNGYDHWHRDEMFLFAIKNGQLFMYESEKWILLNSDVLDFRNNTMLLFNECRIDKNGNVLNLHEYETGSYSKTRKG